MTLLSLIIITWSSNKMNGEGQRDFAFSASYLNNVMNAITTPMIGKASTKPIPINIILIN